MTNMRMELKTMRLPLIYKTASGQTVAQLAGVDSKVSACPFTVDGNGQINAGTVTIDNAVYTLENGAWTAAKSK